MDTESIYLYPRHDSLLSWKAHEGVWRLMLFSDVLLCLKGDTKKKVR